MEHKSDFFNKLRMQPTYAEKIAFLEKVTHSNRLAMLWLYIETLELPDQDFLATSEELLYLWQHMPHRNVSIDDSERAMEHHHIEAMKLWVKSKDNISAPCIQSRIVPGMPRTSLAFLFKELLKAHLCKIGVEME